MLRKIILLVPTIALALLLVNRLARKIGADGLAWAQDSSAADDGSGDDAAPDKSSAIKFSGSGTLEATPVTPCSADECFSVTGMVTKTSVKGLGTGDITGDTTFDNCKIKKAAKEECCTFASVETYSFSIGNLDVMYGGTICGKKPTNAMARKSRFEITGGTGSFADATGSGTATFKFNAETDHGTFSFKGKLSE